MGSSLSKPRLLVCQLLGAVALLCGLAGSATAAEGSLRVLFLGDRGHHNPADRAAQISPVLANRGVEVTYTEDPGVLDADFLSRFDALLIFANIDTITPAQEAGLLSYVESGGGFVPIHCASFCFRNSEKYVALVGAQFQSHSTGEFETKVVAPEHPIMQGLIPFVTWDETYLHSQHNTSNRTVLQVRMEKDRAEPWTWVRTQGQGRVFYTAYGHDERTWMQPGFHDLIERGIRWAANKHVVDHGAEPVAKLKPFEYTDATGGLPNYTPGGKWGALGEPITKMQLPLEPAESMKHLVLPPGFEPELFASDPDIFKPIAMCWDEAGRTFIAETFDYPNNMQRAGNGHDRITVCEDTNGDRQADKFTVFAENLSIPTSITPAFGGLIVHQAPHTLFLKDTNGDGQADVREPLFSGWKTDDTHAGPSNLRYGFDNWYYGMVGYAGFEGTVAGERLTFNRGFYRFQLEPTTGPVPRVTRLEFLRSVSNNAWGVGLSEEGLVFGSTANGCPSVFMAIPNRYYESVRGWSPSVLPSISSSNRYFPITERVRQVDFHGGFTSAAGHALYTARNYPQQYWNRTAFVSDPTGHLTATFTLQPKGSDFTAYNGWNLVASDDEWTAPIVAEVGPDGNVWVIDWYNYVVQHNPTPAGFETGKGNAYETPLRDKRHGRIYRIVHENGTPTPAPKLDVDDPASLLAALDHPNLFWRLTAQRLLIERGKVDVVPRLVALVQDETVDATGLAPAAVHAVWTLHGLDGVEWFGQNALTDALSHPSAAVRRATVVALPRESRGRDKLLQSKVLSDADPQVRLAALLAVAEMPAENSDSPAAAAAAALRDAATLSDRWLPDAATAAASAHADVFLQVIARGGPLPRPGLEVVSRVSEHYARGGPADSVGRVLNSAVEADPAVAEAVVMGLAAGWPAKTTAKFDEQAAAAVKTLFPKLSPGGRGSLLQLAATWKLPGLDTLTAELAASFLKAASDRQAKDSDRVAAARRLIELRPADAEAAGELLDLVTPQASPELAVGLINAIGNGTSPAIAAELVSHFAAFTPGARGAAVRVLLSRAEWTRELLTALDAGGMTLSDLTLDQRQALAAHPDTEIARQAKELMAKGGGLPNADRQKVIEELMPVVLKGGDPTHGKLLFTQQCGKCHKHAGEGSEIGPDLTGMASHSREELLIHILDPSRSVEGNFRQFTAVTIDGLVLSGLLGSETKTSIELIDNEGKRHPIPREEIDELIASSKSVMPEGFEKQLNEAGMRDLLAFLTKRGKYLPLDLRKVATTSSATGMFYSSANPSERLVFSDWSPKEFTGVPFYLINPQEGRAPNVVLLHGPNGTTPPRMPKSVSVGVHGPAKAVHLLGGIAGWGHPLGEVGSVSMIVRLHYADGETEDHPLRNGIEIADYIRVIDVPESELAFKLAGGQQIRYLAVQPRRTAEIAEIELQKGNDATAPVVVAITVETNSP